MLGANPQMIKSSVKKGIVLGDTGGPLVLDNVASGILLRVQMTLCQVNIQYSCNRRETGERDRGGGGGDLPCI